MKKIGLFVLSVVFVLFAIAGCAVATGSLEFTLINNDTEYEVSSNIGLSGNVVIPATYKGLPVTRIGDNAFMFRGGIKSVKVPSSVTGIGDNAFAGCSNLASVTFEENSRLTSIGDNVFANCRNLKKVKIPSSVTNIGKYAFAGCKSLTDIEIPSSVTSIGQYVFSACDSLTSISVAEDNTAYKDIDGVLLNKDGTELIHYPAGKSATSYAIPNGVTYIVELAFAGCENLTKITIPPSVTEIGNNAFAFCFGLESVTFEKNSELTSIGDGAFVYCSSLKGIEIPASVTSIGAAALSCCSFDTLDEDNVIHIVIVSSLTSITVEAGNTVYKDIDGVLFNKGGTELIRYPAGKSETGYTVPGGVTDIVEGAFSGCESLKSVTFEENSELISIGEGAFSLCGLTSIVIPLSVKSIGNGAFSLCRLTSIIIPLSVESMGKDVFLCGEGFTVYAEAAKKPSGWDDEWIGNYRVVWGYKD